MKTKNSTQLFYHTKSLLLFLLVLQFFIIQIEPIKFWKNKTQTIFKTQNNEIKPKQNEKYNQNYSNVKKQNQKQQKTNQNPNDSKQIQKQKQISPAVITKKQEILKSKQVVQASDQSGKVLDSLFSPTEKQNSKLPTSKNTPVKSSINLTPQKPPQVQNSVNQQTFPITTTISMPQAVSISNMIGGLFGQDNIKNEQSNQIIGKHQTQQAQLNIIKEQRESQNKANTQKAVKKNEQLKNTKSQKKENIHQKQDQSMEQSSDKVKGKETKTNSNQQSIKSSKQPKQSEIKATNQQDDSSQEIIYPNSWKKNQKKVFKAKDKKGENKVQQAPNNYNLALLLTFSFYSFIVVLVLITIKYSSRVMAVKAVEIMGDAVGNLFKKRKGYRPTLNQQQITEKQEQITVGYSIEDNNKQIFWEKNSVEGI